MSQGGGWSRFMFPCGVVISGGSACRSCGAGPQAPTEGCEMCALRSRKDVASREHYPVSVGDSGLVCMRCGVACDEFGESTSDEDAHARAEWAAMRAAVSE